MDNVWLVPVPSKDTVNGTVSSRSHAMLLECLRDTTYADGVLTALSWTKKLAKAHQGGPRGREALEPFLQAGNVAGKRIVLVDDLISTGGTMLAARDALVTAGAEVVCGLACGRTVYDFETEPFENSAFELDKELADWKPS